MKKESFQGILLGVVIMCAVFAFITVAWAAFSSTLTIGGSATIAAQKWDVDLTNTVDTAWTASQTLTGTKTGAADITAATLKIDADRVISGSVGTLNQPGDSITYTWYGQNFGTFDADISYASGILASKTTGGSNVSLTCALASGETWANKDSGGNSITTQDFCDQYISAVLYYAAPAATISTTPTYLEVGQSTNFKLAKANTTDSTDVVPFKLVITYNSSSDTLALATGKIEVTINDVVLNANQSTSTTASSASSV